MPKTQAPPEGSNAVPVWASYRGILVVYHPKKVLHSSLRFNAVPFWVSDTHRGF